MLTTLKTSLKIILVLLILLSCKKEEDDNFWSKNRSRIVGIEDTMYLDYYDDTIRIQETLHNGRFKLPGLDMNIFRPMFLGSVKNFTVKFNDGLNSKVRLDSKYFTTESSIDWSVSEVPLYMRHLIKASYVSPPLIGICSHCFYYNIYYGSLQGNFITVLEDLDPAAFEKCSKEGLLIGIIHYTYLYNIKGSIKIIWRYHPISSGYLPG